MQPWLPRLLIVPDWWKSKCGGRKVMAYFSTPPDLALGSGALSWNFEPSNSLGTPWARACHGMPNTVAPSAADPFDEVTTIYAGTLLTLVHDISSHLVFCRPRTMCCDGLSIIMDQN